MIPSMSADEILQVTARCHDNGCLIRGGEISIDTHSVLGKIHIIQTQHADNHLLNNNNNNIKFI